MQAVLKTNDVVLLSFAEALLADVGISATVFDGHMSVMDGSLGVLPRRLMVADDDVDCAIDVLKNSLANYEPLP